MAVEHDQLVAAYLVPAYLGRVLNSDGSPVGTCFQVSPGIVVTAWHVLDSLGAGEKDNVVRVDSLSGGREPSDAVVRAIDDLADLAVLEMEKSLGGSVAGLGATDAVAFDARVRVTGVAEVNDPGHEYRHIDAPGKWRGGTTRDNSLPLGRLTSSDIVLGMSGAPVRHGESDVVVGVVSARYNSADGWLRNSVWVARTERLMALCEGIVKLNVPDIVAATAVDLVLSIGEHDVRLRGGDVDMSVSHSGIGSVLSGAIDDMRRARVQAVGAREGLARAGWLLMESFLPPGIESVLSGALDDVRRARVLTVGAREGLARAGKLLTESFLPEPVAAVVGTMVARAERGHQAVRLGIDCSGEMAKLPWEALCDPRNDRPLVLQPLTRLYRRIAGGAPAGMSGPLRILVAIASPDPNGGAILDYERELGSVLAAVRTARQGQAHVRIVRFATTASIRAALEVEPVHVLHLSGHAVPGRFVFENDRGGARPLGADEFVDEAIPPGRMPTVVALSACHSNVAAAGEDASFAERLFKRGASSVIASETSITDVYATRIFSRIYARLTDATVPDVVAVTCDVRRAVQAELENATDEREKSLGGLDEWAVLSVLADSGSIIVFDPNIPHTPPPPPPPRFAIGSVAARLVGDVVGRRHEQRHWPSELMQSTYAGLVLHGIGGIGKTTLAAELAARVLEHDGGRVHVFLTGQLSIDGLLGGVTASLRRHAMVGGQWNGPLESALTAAARSDLSWSDRLAILRDHVLSVLPLLVVLDNFEDNVHRDGGEMRVRDPIAEPLADWISDPRDSRMLITCRYPFVLPRSAEHRLSFKVVGPLSAAETGKLIWSLPELDRLSPDDMKRVWLLVGGHPRSLEYLDALLSHGQGRYPDITKHLHDAVTKRLGTSENASTFFKETRKLDDAMAEVATLAADDVLLDQLLRDLDATEGARELLLGISVYREPVDINGILYQVGEPDDQIAIEVDKLPSAVRAAITPHVEEMQRFPTPPRTTPKQLDQMVDACVASSLLSIEAEEGEAGRRMFVHRWTAGELARRQTAADRSEEIVAAHSRAGDYWFWKASVWPQERRAYIHDLLEARHHQLAAERLEPAFVSTAMVCSQIHEWGAWDDEAALIHDTLPSPLQQRSRRISLDPPARDGRPSAGEPR